MTDTRRFDVYLKPAAERALKKIVDRTARRRIARAIDGLATTARPPQAVRLQGSHGLLRIRTGDYRIIYTVEDATRTVLIATIGHRRDVYRR
ncbi:MAG: type II toxin-antitoxin system RelE/ParE family toxin [Gemmatimonadetes bacterium]|nr:type II toxin-antitoxin system RelE/ParE family toxin [Gemmatimonadota bacterium]MCY3679347.1 type II toxin-antitoxin system RelE/ParE family toxin [Gemmatimonadota bacterium]MYA42095.1 type II toxin-antitoxin system RelE/ParE family toxin [Gemmatimonadota bacterium]MYE94139.1 type II toxin-antitoxin system RelE/ParE family toxin [Gemmatimonadota bacterium]MYJ09028.1 type II toxin-antitoxin system RelE/ParE family toxin [Gemmatimonadota bacterium]